MVFGTDLLGREPSGGHISGPFGAHSRKFGTTLAVFAPLCWVYFLRRGAVAGLAAAVLASGYIVLVAGARAGWVSLLVCAVAFAVIYRARLAKVPRGVVIAGLVLAAVLPVVAYNTIDAVEFRVGLGHCDRFAHPRCRHHQAGRSHDALFHRFTGRDVFGMRHA